MTVCACLQFPWSVSLKCNTPGFDKTHGVSVPASQRAFVLSATPLFFSLFDYSRRGCYLVIVVYNQTKFLILPQPIVRCPAPGLYQIKTKQKQKEPQNKTQKKQPGTISK